MNKEDVKVGVTFILTKGVDADIINKSIEQKIEFTIKDISKLHSFQSLIYCSIGNCHDQDLLDSFEHYFEDDEHSPGFGYLKMSAYDSELVNMQVVSVTKESSKSNYPHVCPRCGAPAYVGLFTVDCTKCK